MMKHYSFNWQSFDSGPFLREVDRHILKCLLLEVRFVVIVWLKGLCELPNGLVQFIDLQNFADIWVFIYLLDFGELLSVSLRALVGSKQIFDYRDILRLMAAFKLREIWLSSCFQKHSDNFVFWDCTKMKALNYM